MAQEPLCSSSLGLQSLHCGCAWPQPCLGLSLGFQLTLKSMCNLLSTCGSLSCHQDPLLSLPCSACWAQMPRDCAQVLSKSCAMGTISYSRGCATLLSLSCWWCSNSLIIKKKTKKKPAHKPPKNPQAAKKPDCLLQFSAWDPCSGRVLTEAGISPAHLVSNSEQAIEDSNLTILWSILLFHSTKVPSVPLAILTHINSFTSWRHPFPLSLAAFAALPKHHYLSQEPQLTLF